MRVYDAQGREVDVRGYNDGYGNALGDLPGGVAAKAAHGIGAEQYGEEYRGYSEVSDQYIINIHMSGDPAGQPQANSVPLRPYDFVLKQITYACTGDASNMDGTVNPFWQPPGGSMMARVTEMEWFDEYTKFMGDRRALIAAVTGDSNGFLPLPRMIRFIGKQTLSVRINAISYPWPDPDPDPYPEFRHDFVFHGVDLYPPNVVRVAKSAEE